jgi:hypothetical protein
MLSSLKLTVATRGVDGQFILKVCKTMHQAEDTRSRSDKNMTNVMFVEETLKNQPEKKTSLRRGL